MINLVTINNISHMEWGNKPIIRSVLKDVRKPDSLEVRLSQEAFRTVQLRTSGQVEALLFKHTPLFHPETSAETPETSPKIHIVTPEIRENALLKLRNTLVELGWWTEKDANNMTIFVLQHSNRFPHMYYEGEQMEETEQKSIRAQENIRYSVLWQDILRDSINYAMYIVRLRRNYASYSFKELVRLADETAGRALHNKKY